MVYQHSRFSRIEYVRALGISMMDTMLLNRADLVATVGLEIGIVNMMMMSMFCAMRLESVEKEKVSRTCRFVCRCFSSLPASRARTSENNEAFVVLTRRGNVKVQRNETNKQISYVGMVW